MICELCNQPIEAGDLYIEARRWPANPERVSLDDISPHPIHVGACPSRGEALEWCEHQRIRPRISWSVDWGEPTMSPDEEEVLRRLAAWWRHCKGDDSFRQALHFCANQLELALDGELPPFNATVSQGGKRPKWIPRNQPGVMPGASILNPETGEVTHMPGKWADNFPKEKSPGPVGNQP